MENIIENIIENKLRNLLELISIKYSTKFKHEYIDCEIEYLKKHIMIKQNMENIENIKKVKKVKKIKSKPIIKEHERCNGRSWSNDIIERTTMTKITEINKQFKVNNFNDINNKLFNEKYIIGVQCRHKKIENKKYCKLHENHLIHGDYREIPSKEICYHFMKDGKYL